MKNQFTSSIVRLCVVTAMLTLTGAARAETMDDMRFGDLMTLKMMDKNKDGMISKAEFLEMMGKVWDAKAKKMGVKGDKMTPAEFDEIAKYLRAGG
jgi:Ca2+-binding EF-hand superfamily protein